MRLYLHLTDGHEEIRDAEGVEVGDLNKEARVRVVRAVVGAIKELRREDAPAAYNWSGWTLAVAEVVLI